MAACRSSAARANCVAELHERGIPTAVATSSRNPHAQHHLGAAGLLDLFDTVVTRDDVVNPKPHPEPYLTAARRLGVDPLQCLALEDSHAGVRAAHAAGMQTIMVPDLVHPSEEIRALGIAVMESLDHVRAGRLSAALSRCQIAPCRSRPALFPRCNTPQQSCRLRQMRP